MKKSIKTKTKMLASFVLFFILALNLSSQNALSMSNEDCLECHGDEDLTREEDDSSIYVNAYSLVQSVHGEEECITCHQDADVEDEHPVKLEKVSCEECHEDVGEIYENSMHGQARKRDDDLAPHCFTCHGTHNILPSSDPKSNTYVLNIPVTCGKCHQEGTPMTKTHVIGQHNVLENYSMSIHGRGL